VQRWTHDFADGKAELDSAPRPGRLTNPENTTRARELIEYELYISQKTIASRFGIHHEPVKRILKHELGLVKVSFKWISHLLADFQKQQRIDIASEFLQFFEASSPQKLCRVFTGDESWFFLDNPRNSMWAASGVLRSARVRRDIEAQR
jgi:hypothetical protein